jgi:tetratricopeptide (TPR) repeat protein
MLWDAGAMEPRIHDAGPGRAADANRLLALHEEIASGSRMGATVFVGGGEGQGRAALFEAVALELGRSGSLVVAGCMERERFLPWNLDDPRRMRAFALLGAVMPLAEALSPVVGLLSLLVSEGSAAWHLVSAMKESGERVEPWVLLPQLLRVRAREGPVVCLIDHAEGADPGWWGDLLVLFANEIASDLPVLLVLGLDGPVDLDAEGPETSSGLYAARTLTRRRLAEWWPLAPIEREDVAGWVGPAEAVVIDGLMAASGGRSAMAADLWSSWKVAGIVELRNEDRRWHFTADGETNLVLERLKRVRAVGGSLECLERVRLILSVAALEGRQFTAEAVGRVLGLGREEILDYLDDSLAVSSENPDGLVVELGSLGVPDGHGPRVVWIYRFVCELDFATLRHWSLTPEERAEYSGVLAKALIACYAGAKLLAVATVARLYQVGGDSELAREYWRLSRIGQNDAIARSRAQALLDGVEPVGQLERTHAAEVLIAAAATLYTSGPMADGLALSQAALRYAVDGSMEQFHGHYYSAWFRLYLDQREQARSELAVALAIAERRHLRLSIADATHQLANLDYHDKDYESATKRYNRVLKVREVLRDPAGIATVREMLAELKVVDGDLDGAYTEQVAVRELVDQLNDPYRQTMARVRLARIAMHSESTYRERYPQARELLDEALTIIRADGNDRVEGIVLHELATVAHLADKPQIARDRALEAIPLSQKEPHALATTHLLLGMLEIELDKPRGARDQLRTALEIYRGNGDQAGECECQELLDEIDAD